MERKKSIRTIVAVVFIVVLAVVAFVAASRLNQTPVPAFNGASPVGLELTR